MKLPLMILKTRRRKVTILKTGRRILLTRTLSVLIQARRQKDSDPRKVREGRQESN